MVIYKKKEVSMKKIGIIAEYNPFHNGHLYQIEEVKKKYPDSILIVVMNGNFAQRGEVTLFDKWTRTEFALKNGIDLVIELPYPFSTQSADYYAEGAMTILETLGCDTVIFGSESNQIDTLTEIAKAGLDEEVGKLVKVYCKLGNNYPTAISLAIEETTGKKVDTPNDLLGVSYIKAILKNKFQIKPETIQRTSDYHSKEANNSIASASAIREMIKEQKDYSFYVPKNTIQNNLIFHDTDDYFPLLKYKILTDNNLEQYQTVDETYCKKLKKEILSSNSREELIQRIKRKHDTYNKISRMLLHILCGFTKEKAKEFQKIPYLRVLGFNQAGRSYLNQIKKQLPIPLISKITKEKEKMLEYEMETSKIYDIPYHGDSYEKEYKKNKKEDI